MSNLYNSHLLFLFFFFCKHLIYFLKCEVYCFVENASLIHPPLKNASPFIYHRKYCTCLHTNSTLSQFENERNVIASFMIGRTKACTLLSGHRKICEQLQKGAVETLAHIYTIYSDAASILKFGFSLILFCPVLSFEQAQSTYKTIMLNALSCPFQFSWTWTALPLPNPNCRLAYTGSTFLCNKLIPTYHNRITALT